MTTGISPQKGTRTRQQVLDAAFRLFVRQGFAATSMRQVAARAHLALGGIYNHFPSKEAIFQAIVEERHPFFQIVPLINTVQGETVEEFVRNAAHALVGELGHHPDYLNLMLIEIVEFKARHAPAVFDKLLPLVLPLASRIGDARDHVRAIPPLVLARAFLGMFFSYYITEILMGRLMEIRQEGPAIDHFVDIFLHGILEEAR
jgi:AcrR family transcriptional regulator